MSICLWHALLRFWQQSCIMEYVVWTSFLTEAEACILWPKREHADSMQLEAYCICCHSSSEQVLYNLPLCVIDAAHFAVSCCESTQSFTAAVVGKGASNFISAMLQDGFRAVC